MKKINNKENLNNINIRLRQFPLINSLYKKVRSFKTPLKKSSNRKSNSLNRIIIAIIVVFITGFVIFNIKHYFDIKPNPYFVNDESSKNRVIYSVDSEFNTIFLGFDDRKNDYRFLDMIVINSLDIKKGIMKTYGINPYILVNLSDYKDFSLRSLLNNLEINDSQKMNILMKAIENIIGIRIDRYVSYNYSDFNKFLNDSSISFTAIDSKKTSNGLVNKGDQLSGEILSRYLIDNNTFDDNILKKYVQFIISYLEEFKGFPFQYKNFIKSDEILKYMHTNMDKGELIKYFSGVASISSTSKFGYTLQPKQYQVSVTQDIISTSSDDSSKSTNVNTGASSNSSSVNNGSSLSKSSSSTAITNSVDKTLQESLIPKEFQLDELQVDENIAKVFNNNDIAKEQAKLEIYNASDEKGLAYFKKREYEHLGATVVKYGNFPSNYDETTLYIPKSNEASFINTSNMLRIDLRGKLKVIIGDYKYNYSGDMILVFGKDYIQDN